MALPEKPQTSRLEELPEGVGRTEAWGSDSLIYHVQITFLIRRLQNN